MSRISTPMKQGSIVIAPIVPDAGRIKPRPAIVLTPTREIESASFIDVIGITSSYFPDDALYVEMPFTDNGRGPTRFAKPCAAKLSLVQRFPKAKIWPTDGYLPKKKSRYSDRQTEQLFI